MPRFPFIQSFSAPLPGRGTFLAVVILLGVVSATPAATETIALNELWRIGGEEESEEYLIGVISGVTTDPAGQIYLLDAQLNEVMVLSPEGEYLQSIGREGEGPGEFTRPQDVFLTSDGLIAVVQRFPGKIVLLTPEGEPAGEFPVPRTEDGGTFRLSGARPTVDGLVLEIAERRRRGDGMDMTLRLVQVDTNGKIQAEFATAETSFDFASRSFDERERTGGQWLWGTGTNGNVFLYSGWEGYEIDLYNPDGSTAGRVERAFTPRKRSAAEKESVKGRFGFRGRRRGPPMEVIVADTDRDIQRIYPGPNGTVWALTSRGALDAPEGSIGSFDVYDSSGGSIGEYTFEGEGDLQRDGFFFAGDRFYVVTELAAARRAMFGQGGDDDESEEVEAVPVSVICYELPDISG